MNETTFRILMVGLIILSIAISWGVLYQLVHAFGYVASHVCWKS